MLANAGRRRKIQRCKKRHKHPQALWEIVGIFFSGVSRIAAGLPLLELVSLILLPWATMPSSAVAMSAFGSDSWILVGLKRQPFFLAYSHFEKAILKGHVHARVTLNSGNDHDHDHVHDCDGGGDDD